MTAAFKLLVVNGSRAQEEEEEDEDARRQEVAGLIEELLLDKAQMLQEYVGLRISEHAELCSLPRLIDGYHPDTDYLPAFVLALARDVDWSSERECFQGLAQVRSVSIALQRCQDLVVAPGAAKPAMPHRQSPGFPRLAKASLTKLATAAQALSELYCWKAPLFPEAGSGTSSRAGPAGEPQQQPAERASQLQNQADVQREWTVQHVGSPRQSASRFLGRDLVSSLDLVSLLLKRAVWCRSCSQRCGFFGSLRRRGLRTAVCWS